MKKIFKIFLILIITVVLVNLLIKYLKKDHQIEYNINGYDIEEIFYINNNKHYYNYVIKKDNYKYIYSYNKNLDKEKKTIKTIINVAIGKTKCIMPIYSDNKTGNVECFNNKKYVSLLYLKKNNNNNKLYKQIVNKYNKLGYNVEISTNNKKTNYKNLYIYNNIIDKYNYIIWDYKGIYIINNIENKYKKLLDEDKYENDLAIMVGKYYVYMDTNNKYSGFKLYYYDIEKDKLKTFTYDKDNISDNIYFNGVYDNKLYIYDKDTKLQFKFNPYNGKFDKVGNKNDGYYLVKNNKLEFIDYYEFKNILYFNNEVDNESIKDKYNSKMIYLYENYYYVLTDNNEVYKIYKDSINTGVLLFKLDNIDNFYIKDNNLFIISDKYLYVYNDENLLNKIISYNELKYNNKNICDLYIS